MSTHGANEKHKIETTKNTARFFVENRQIAWVALLGVLLWGIVAYTTMPKRKDPEIPVRVAAVVAFWPGAPAQKMEELVTRRLEDKIAENPNIEKIMSNTRNGVSVVQFLVEERVKERSREFDDINLRLGTLQNLPQGTQVVFQKDFGQTTALMLTVSSPRPSEVEVQLRAAQIQRDIEQLRKGLPEKLQANRVSLIYPFPATLEPVSLQRTIEGMAGSIGKVQHLSDPRMIRGPGYLGLDMQSSVQGDNGKIEKDLRAWALAYLQDHLHTIPRAARS
jgi:hypothetical protein